MTELPNPPTPRAPSRRRVRVVLVLSLMVNLLLIGVLAGGVLRFARFEPPIAAQPDFRSLWRALPGEARADLRSHRHDRQRPDGARRAQAAAVNAEIVQLLRAEPFDRAAFAALLSRERQAMARRMTEAQRAFADRVATLSHNERVQMAERFEAARGRRRGH